VAVAGGMAVAFGVAGLNTQDASRANQHGTEHGPSAGYGADAQ
jgi:hypothetical protein